MAENGKNSIVKKHNALIEARHTKVLDVRAVRLIALAASRITVKDKDFQTYQIPVKSITNSPDVYNVSKTKDGIVSDDKVLVIDKITDQLLANVIRLPRKDKDGQMTGKSWAKYSYFSKCQYISGTGYVELQFHPDLKDHFLQLKNNFTQLSLEILCSLPSTYSYRLYELLKQYAQGGIFKRAFVISDLQDMIGVKSGPKSTYRKYGRFREKVILPAQENFKKHTDLLFEFRAWASYGRSYTDIEFTMSKNSTYIQGNLFGTINDNHGVDESLPEIPQKLIDIVPEDQWENKQNGCKQIICKEILPTQGLDAVEFYINYVHDLEKTEKRTSWGKTIRAALKNKLYEAHLKNFSDLKQKQIEEQKEQDHKDKDLQAKKQIIADESKENERIDSIIKQLLGSDKAKTFNKFVADQVKNNENAVVKERYKKKQGSTEQTMQRKYFDSYFSSLYRSKNQESSCCFLFKKNKIYFLGSLKPL